MLHCGWHENDTPCSFVEFLGGVDEFVRALDATPAAVCSAQVVDSFEVIWAFVDVSVGIGPPEEDHFCCWSEQCEVGEVESVNGKVNGGAFFEDGEAVVGSL